MAIEVGEAAPAIDELEGPHAIVFYKVTCSVVAMAGRALAKLGTYGDSVIGVGQDPQLDLDAFAAAQGWTFPQRPDLAPYEVSNAYGVVSSPTLVVVDADRRVADVAESWDRDGMNRASATLAHLLGAEPVVVSDPSDGLPAFKPG